MKAISKETAKKKISIEIYVDELSPQSISYIFSNIKKSIFNGEKISDTIQNSVSIANFVIHENTGFFEEKYIQSELKEINGVICEVYQSKINLM